MRLLGAILVASGLCIAGCKSGDKKSSAGGLASRNRGAPFWADQDKSGPANPSKNDDPLVPAGRGESEAMLAGRVIDASGRPAGNTFIQVSLVEQANAKPAGTPH